MIQRFAKAFHLLSVLAFIVIFLYIYAALPEMVKLKIDTEGNPLQLISRNTFFYIGIGLFILLNVILIIPAKLIESGASFNMKRLFPKGDVLREYILGWIYSFVTVVNFSIVVVSVFVHQLNGVADETGEPFEFGLYLLPVLFVVWIIMLFIILSRKLQEVRS
ncbi:hypothetical protein [Echinicola pacifica]|nr:hypothetical protein [Echinicola pacifica]